MANNNHGRRHFFRTFLQRVVDPVADYAEKRLPQSRTLLRPPGALPEREFLSTCYHCGNCADSCPVDAIVETRVFEFHMEQKGENIMTKEKLLAVGAKYEAQIAADRATDSRYR